MLIHDWTRLDPEVFPGFHARWCVHLAGTINQSEVADNYFADLEQIAAPARPRSRVAVWHAATRKVVAAVEIVASLNKADRPALDVFVDRIGDTLRAGVHVSVIDLFPPGPHDPNGVHDAITRRLYRAEYQLPPATPLTFASYFAWPSVGAVVQHAAVGAVHPSMSLVLSNDQSISVWLEPSYTLAWNGTPYFWREQVAGPGA